MFLLVGFEQVLDSRADDSLGVSATIDHTDGSLEDRPTAKNAPGEVCQLME
jgi:hypothetical protein